MIDSRVYPIEAARTEASHACGGDLIMVNRHLPDRVDAEGPSIASGKYSEPGAV